ncbi:hypothetical protein V1264_000110 [Littorina saxatilis]|uniref:Uncharacterized protein n=1 Tax=Littorina saxatilis TaxID=31220 RepID=A0AAN9C3X5_9CAEN
MSCLFSVLENPGKWDLSKAFIFVMKNRSSIALVHVHPEDRKELVVAKKALASLFSVDIQEEQGKEKWRYTIQEADHLGDLKHDYTARRTAQGLTLHRQHASVDKAHRFHDKTLHYDHQGILQSAVARDRVLLTDRSSGVSRKTVVPDDQPSSGAGDFPDIEVTSHATVEYKGKRRTEHMNATKHREILDTLRADTLETHHERVRTNLDKVQQNITRAWECVHSNPIKDSENRTECVNQLRGFLKDLNIPEYKAYVSKLLGKTCDSNNTVCEDDRLILLDIVTRLGDVTSQNLVVTYVLTKRPLVDEELRRVFIHSAALEHPTKRFVAAVATVCFGDKGELHGQRKLGRTQTRACLAVGSLVKHLAGSGQQQYADNLAHRLETWLDQHRKGDVPIKRRETTQVHHAWMSEEEEAQHMGKAVLLHSLGNAALERSKPHLLLHAAPNSGHHIWRRAALDALRHYKCHESVHAMFKTATQDETPSVRRMALSVFMNHPRRHDVTRDTESDLLSKNYSYRAVTRVKRSVVEEVLFQFKAEIPSYEWSKELGSSKAGASFGVKFQNSVEGAFRWLSGYVDVDVHDKLWAEAHLGFLDWRIDILLAEICYKGRLSYNMNIVKDYTVDLTKDINSVFDLIIDQVMEPIRNFSDAMVSQYEDVATGQPRSGFQPLADAVRNLPTQTNAALQATRAFNEEADLLGALPLVKKLQALTSRAQSLMEDIHSEATDIFTDLADVAEIGLPFAEKEIRTAINSTLGVLKRVRDSPRQAFTVIERAKLRYQLALLRIFEGRKIIKEVFSFFSGGRSSWNGAGEELRSITDQTRSLVSRLRAHYARRKRQTGTNTAASFYTQCGTVDVEDSLARLYNKSEVMIEHFEVILLQSPTELQHALDRMNQQTEVLKTSFAGLKEAIDVIRSRMNALFGVKFHPNFPSQRRDCDSGCGCGYYPTDCTRYGHPGIDLVWSKGWKVVNPVSGMVYVEGRNAVRIEPQTADLHEYQIVISNIQLNADFKDQTEFYLEAGELLGYSLGASGCSKDHIHLAMKRTSNDTGMCRYLDPSPFIDTPQPSPTWYLECSEFTLKHIGQTSDFGILTDGFSSKLTKLKRLAMEWTDKARTFVQDLIPDDSFLAPLKDGFVFELEVNVSSLENVFRKKKGVSAANGFFKALKSKRLPFGNFLRTSMQSSKMRSRVDKLLKIADTVSTLVNVSAKMYRLGNRTIGAVHRLLQEVEFDHDEDDYQDLFADIELPPDLLPPKGVMPGGKDKLLLVLTTKLRSDMCPELGRQLASQDSLCVPHHDCLELACEVIIRRKHASETLNVDIQVDKDQNAVGISLNGQALSVSGNANTAVASGAKIFSVFDVKLKVNTTWGGDALLFSLTLRACGPNLCCLPDVILAKNLFFSNLSISDLRRTFNNSAFNLDELSLEQTYKVLADLDVDSPELAKSIIGLKDLVRDSLLIKLPPESEYITEFENPVEHTDDGRFPVYGQRSQVYIPFIGPVEYPIPVGIWFLLLHASAGGVVGFEYAVYVQTVKSNMKVVLTPWVSAKVEAGVSIDLFVIALGVDIHGWLMITKFPISMEANYTKLPIVTTSRVEVELVPISVRLFVWLEIKLEINLYFFTITIFYKKWEWTLFHLTSPGISTVVWKKIVREEDDGPPRFPSCASANELCIPARRRRSVQTGAAQCHVYQLQGRNPKDTALRLQFSAEDDDSDLDLSYAVGDYPGGSNLKKWTSMQSSPLLVLGDLPCGRPLHFLVRAVNTQGLSRVASCSLPTLDCTLPDGRIDSPSLCTSHRNKLSATVVVYDDSPLQTDQLLSAVGYSPGAHSHEVADWTPLPLNNLQQRPTTSGNLRHFSPPRLGRLAASPVKTLASASPPACAGECLKLVSCLSFSFDEFLYSCELQSVTEGLLAARLEDGQFYTYERLGNGYSAELEYTDLALRHGVRYYVNSVIQNVMGYTSALTSPGVMVDHTPPEPGHVGEFVVDETLISNCSTSVVQRCSEPVEFLAHRKIIDGKGASTVFNGNRRGQDLQFTYENHHASANWDGFTDRECGIHGYAWAVGTSICGSDVSNFTDPHVTHSNAEDWTHVGVAKDLHLAEGPYYVTVQAVNDISHGGDLVTTLCHSTPFLVDITPPVLHSVSDVIFDDGFRLLAVYFNATDNLSGVTGLEFGLGRTKYDVMIRRYLPFEIRGNENNRYLLNEEFETASGTPAWIRLKIVDNVGLSEAGHGTSPILLDSTAPVAGDVMDGNKLGHDTCCQSDSSTICVQWRGFEDPESHIQKYVWGVGSTAGQDDVIAFRELSAHDHHACASELVLTHNATYFSTIIAFNKALNQKIVNASSDGVLVDLTPPQPGIVVDGDDLSHDLNFTSETASVASSWTGFQDPETNIDFYTLSVLVNGVAEHNVTDYVAENFTDHAFNLGHGDEVKVKVKATNRAGSSVEVTSDGLRVDHTPPDLLYLSTADGTSFQQSDSSLHFTWNFEDSESGLAEYRAVVSQLLHRTKTRFWPLGGTDQHVVKLGQSTWNSTQSLVLPGLSLVNGATYSVKVTAVNWASMAAVEESKGVTVDTTPPVIEQVQISMPGDDEEVNEDGEVEHIEGEPIYVSWNAHDFESGLIGIELCIGLQGSECLTSNHTISLDATTLQSSCAVLNEVDLQVSTEGNKFLYMVSVVAINGAGVRSVVATSKPIVVLQDNVAGLVLDGRSDRDDDFTNDKAAIAVTFTNFSSVACGIEGYDWGVGSSPFATDILPYSSSGLVVDADVGGRGKAQAHLMLTEGKTYYVTVRARTGHACHETYILSCSDGITVDTTPPTVTFFATTEETAALSALPSSAPFPSLLTTHDVVIQTAGDKLELGWDVKDIGGVNKTVLRLDLFGPDSQTVRVPTTSLAPFDLSSTLALGDSFFSSLWAVDNAGNEVKELLPVVMVDSTPPSFLGFNCTEIISSISLVLTCEWSVTESHSAVQEIQLGLGSGTSFPDLQSMTSVPLHASQWTFNLGQIWRSGLAALSGFNVIAKATNTAGLKAETSLRVRIDVTPPEVSEVIVVTSPAPVHSRTEKLCQTSHDYIEVELRGLADDESGVQSVEIAVGTSAGTTDIHPFLPYTLVEGVYAKGGLGLPVGSTVFATARVTNRVGLYTVVSGEGVVISPQPRLLVLDGPGPADADGQVDLHLIQGHWKVTDPCPIISASWWVTELGSGREIRNLTDLQDNSRSFYDDTLSLENLKTYVAHVRVTDSVNRTWEAWSDGVTVSLDSPDTARVWEGVAPNDVDYQESLNKITATWESFGNPRSPLPSDQVVRYEVAVGTDPQSHTTRSNVHAFQGVGMDTTFTFHGLNLTAKTVLYHVTVRAYSAAGSFSESSSDGIRVGYSGEISPGKITVEPCQSDNSSIRVAWDGFVSDFGDLRYYVAVSSLRPPWDNSTRDCAVMLNHSFSYDINTLGFVEAQSLVAIHGLSLDHDGSYYVTVMAEDLMSHCSAVVSDPIRVDTTPPVSGDIIVQGYDTDTVTFLHSRDTLFVDLTDFLDEESGIDTARVQLFSSQNCGLPSPQDLLVGEVTAREELQITMRDLDLGDSGMYYLKVQLTNRARLETRATSKPLLVSVSPPTSGAVKLGTDWTGEEQIFSSRTDTVKGMIAVSSRDTETECRTEIDMISDKNRLLWDAAHENFSSDCVFIEDTGISLLLQHNTRLTGVDRGAVQLNNLFLVEGSYTFRMTAASGQRVLTGVSLSSPSLLPPFSDQSEILTASDGCDTTLDDCARDDSSNRSRMLPESDYGFGVSFAEVDGTMMTLFWAQDALKLKQTRLSLDFNPTSTPADYVFTLKTIAGGGLEVTLSVNDQVQAGFTGLNFLHNLTLTMYTWNLDGYVPPVTDPLTPFRSLAKVTAVKTPAWPRPACSHGSPFMDSNVGLRDVWVGVSSSFNQTADVAPFRLLKTFCIPCLNGCTNICSASCRNRLDSGYNILPLSLNGLRLTAANDAMRDSISVSPPNVSADVNVSASEMLDNLQLPMYYLDVKVTSQSGHVTMAKSSALTVDTSPPVVNDIYCIDPSYEEGQAVDYIGTNSSVGAVWEVSEDVSDMTSQWLCVGTQSGVDDVASWIEVDRLASKHVFKNLNPSLTDGSTYHVSLRVFNPAGLSVTTSVPFTVSVSPPDMSVMAPAPANVTKVMNVSGESVAFTNRTDTMKLSLNFQTTAEESDNGPVMIEWSIGTQPGKDDIFPRSVVANRNVTTVAIVNGYVELEGQTTNITVQDYVNMNFQPSNLTDAVSGAVFRMEPGRCLRQSVYGVSRSHTVTEGPAMEPVCIQREGDQLVLAGNTTLRVGGNTRSTSSQSSSDDIKIRISLTSGGVMVGSLEEDDLNAVYGTAASVQFVSFIVRPDPLDRTSRLLRQRLVSLPGPHLYLSPVADVKFEDDVDLVYPVSADVIVPPGSDVMLLFWVAECQEWKSVVELCPFSTQTYNNQTGQIHSKVCFGVFVDRCNTSNSGGQRRRRSVDTPTPTPLTPRMFTVAVVGPIPPNTPPAVRNTSLVLREDDVKSGIVITYTDDEDDVMTFTLLQAPLHGTVTVTSDGQVTYVPEGNYVGSDVIVLQGVEKLDEASKRAGVVPNVVNVSLTVSVAGVNDPPNLFYLAGTNDSNVWVELLVGPAAGNGINVSVLVEGNTTSLVDLGLIVYGDVDVNDTLVFVNHTRDDVNATFDVTDVSLEDPRLSGLNVSGTAGGAGARAVSLRLGDSYHGEVSYDVRVRDVAGDYSLQLTLGVHVMISPCVYGHCEVTTPTGSCLDPRRAFTFDPFRCHCDPGYEGEWCQTETDECRKAACSPVTDCVDLINGFRCDPNPEKTAAIVLCSVVAVILIAAAVVMIRKNKKHRPNVKDTLKKGINLKDSTGLSRPPAHHRNWAFDNQGYGGPRSDDMFSPSDSRPASAFEPMPKPAKNMWRPLYAGGVTLDEALPRPTSAIWRPQEVQTNVTDEDLVEERYPPWDVESWDEASTMSDENENEGGWMDLPRVGDAELNGSISSGYSPSSVDGVSMTERLRDISEPAGRTTMPPLRHAKPDPISTLRPSGINAPARQRPLLRGNKNEHRAPIYDARSGKQPRLHRDSHVNYPTSNARGRHTPMLLRPSFDREDLLFKTRGRLNPGFEHEDPLAGTPSPDYPPFTGNAHNNTTQADVYAVPWRNRAKE